MRRTLPVLSWLASATMANAAESAEDVSCLDHDFRKSTHRAHLPLHLQLYSMAMTPGSDANRLSETAEFKRVATSWTPFQAALRTARSGPWAPQGIRLHATVPRRYRPCQRRGVTNARHLIIVVAAVGMTSGSSRKGRIRRLPAHRGSRLQAPKA